MREVSYEEYERLRDEGAHELCEDADYHEDYSGEYYTVIYEREKAAQLSANNLEERIKFEGEFKAFDESVPKSNINEMINSLRQFDKIYFLECKKAQLSDKVSKLSEFDKKEEIRLLESQLRIHFNNLEILKEQIIEENFNIIRQLGIGMDDWLDDKVQEENPHLVTAIIRTRDRINKLKCLDIKAKLEECKSELKDVTDELDKFNSLVKYVGFTVLDKKIIDEVNRWQMNMPFIPEDSLQIKWLLKHYPLMKPETRKKANDDKFTSIDDIIIYNMIGFLPAQWEQRQKCVENLFNRLNTKGTHIMRYEEDAAERMKEAGSLSPEQLKEKERAGRRAMSIAEKHEYKRIRANHNYIDDLPCYEEVEYVYQQLKNPNEYMIEYYMDEAAAMLLALNIFDKIQFNNSRNHERGLKHHNYWVSAITNRFDDLFPNGADSHTARQDLLDYVESFYRKTT